LLTEHIAHVIPRTMRRNVRAAKPVCSRWITLSVRHAHTRELCFVIELLSALVQKQWTTQHNGTALCEHLTSLTLHVGLQHCSTVQENIWISYLSWNLCYFSLPKELIVFLCELAGNKSETFSEPINCFLDFCILASSSKLSNLIFSRRIYLWISFISHNKGWLHAQTSLTDRSL